eukprot:1417005-Pleurochrysis_carterae.AAC.1
MSRVRVNQPISIAPCAVVTVARRYGVARYDCVFTLAVLEGVAVARFISFPFLWRACWAYLLSKAARPAMYAVPDCLLSDPYTSCLLYTSDAADDTPC